MQLSLKPEYTPFHLSFDNSLEIFEAGGKALETDRPIFNLRSGYAVLNPGDTSTYFSYLGNFDL